MGRKDIDSIPQLAAMPPEERDAMRAVSAVLPFRVNPYVLDELIDWSKVPEDPIYQLTFPQRGMLEPEDFETMLSLVRGNAGPDEVSRAARAIQLRMNPHPAGQTDLNVPWMDGKPLEGMQHKYRETVLFFPSTGQTCHAYCTYCFRWPQFVGLNELKFASREVNALIRYLKAHEEVNSVLFTGGDPLIMRTELLRQYVEPLLDAGLDHITSIRLGTKSTAYWPQRFVTDPDADDLLRLFESVRKAGKHLAVMAHFSHPRELETPMAQAAIRRIRTTGAVVRCQAPLIRQVNDDPSVWAEMWRLQVHLGAIPYYMFVERDTGPKNYFDVPLVRAWEIFSQAYRRVSGLARTVRGPSMSATPGKVKVCGVSTIGREKVFVLTFEQARDSQWVGHPFFARFDPKATWLDQLRPAFGEKAFFFEAGMREIKRAGRAQVWNDPVPDRRKEIQFDSLVWN
ncbi:MAG TPA: lysine 2,3-aminomutase [Terriglobia bacterium]|nr:lysine 2,3-aminomutase [Terriglobia bacterium]